MKVTLPIAFWSDHKNRGCSQSAIEISRNKRFVTLELDPAALEDILSDADYYASYDPQDGEEEMRYWKPKAQSTLNALKRAME